jgi:hypothetical protein
MRPASYPGKLGGDDEIVEADETFVGGKATKSHEPQEPQREKETSRCRADSDVSMQVVLSGNPFCCSAHEYGSALATPVTVRLAGALPSASLSRHARQEAAVPSVKFRMGRKSRQTDEAKLRCQPKPVPARRVRG